MSKQILIDFGSTYTKVLVIDIEKQVILGRAQAPTTIHTDISNGLNEALSTLEAKTGIGLSGIEKKYASSSAAGGLKMAAIGLVPDLTLEAARRACLGAGAKVVCSYGFEIDEEIVHEIEAAQCDIVLLCGGTDGGDKKVITRNAEVLADSGIRCPILIAGNRVATEKVKDILLKGGKTVYATQNVLPDLETVNVAPAQKLIRDIFITHITKAKGLDRVQEFIGRPIIPTPKATLQAATLLADGTPEEAGLGSLLIVEIGGATTNIHSVAEQTLVTPQTVFRGLPEQRIKRTVEGDLGIRYNAPTIFDMVGQDRFDARLKALVPGMDGDARDSQQHVRFLSNNVGHVPTSEVEQKADIVLAESAVSIAVERHAGTVKQEYSVVGEIMVQHGKNLLPTDNLIGTGGIFKYGVAPQQVLQSALFSLDKPWSLKPKAPATYLDSEYMLYGIGLLAEAFPTEALRVAKKYLSKTTLEENSP